MIRVALFGAGKMGEAIAQTLADTDTISLGELYERPTSQLLGQKRFGVPIKSYGEAHLSDSDVFVDFTEPEAAMDHFRIAAELKKPIVVGTTGLSINQLEEVRELAIHIPCLFAPNLSLGINLLYDLISQAAKSLPDSYDVEIVEMHHRYKADRPSGTALQLARVIAQHRGEMPEVHSVRAGEIVGSHRVIFAGPGERIELVHEAQTRRAFASGVVQAVRFLFGREPGLYFVGDALGLR